MPISAASVVQEISVLQIQQGGKIMSDLISMGSPKGAGKVNAAKSTTVQSEDLGHIKELVEKAYEYLHRISTKLNGHEKPGQEKMVILNKLSSNMDFIEDDCINNKCDYLKFVENGKFNI